MSASAATTSTTSTTETRIAHLLRRTTFGPAPGQVEALAGLGYDAVRSAVLQTTDGDDLADVVAEHGLADEPVLDVPDVGRDNDDRVALLTWWIDRMRDPRGGLHEKMVWFWHSHFTSAMDVCPANALAAQHTTVRRHALGNFRDLARAMVSDPAMLIYLDGAGSRGDSPNENLARELMELFTIGPGHYTEDDVKAAAQALSGWWVDWETAETGWDPDSAYLGAIRFLGRRGRFSATDIVDTLCDHDACAPFVADRIYRFLVGTPASPERRTELGQVFRDADLEIMPLLRAIVDSPEFDASVHRRPRYPIEWFVLVSRVFDLGPTVEEHIWALEHLDQVPFYPPNVAGWPEGDRWVSPSLALARATAVLDLAVDTENDVVFGFDESDPVPAALAACAIHGASDATVAALEEAYWAPYDAEAVNRLLVYLALNSADAVLA